MGCAREARESEKEFGGVWTEMRNLCVCVWYGKTLLEDAEEHVESIKRQLDKTIELMRKEKDDEANNL